MSTSNTAFGALPSPQEQAGTPASQQLQKQRTAAQTSPNAAPTHTFADMQKAGQARPAPTSTQYATTQAAANSPTMMKRLEDTLASFQNSPSRFDTDLFKQIRDAQAANINQEFSDLQQQLNAELARRGLSASTIAAEDLGGLMGDQSRALADLDARLALEAATTQANDRGQLVQGLTQAAQLEQGGDQFQQELALRLGELTGNVGGRETLGSKQLDLRAQEIQQQAALEGRQLDISEARLEADVEMQREQIAETREQFYATLDQRETQFARNLEQQRQESLQQLGVDQQQLDLREREIAKEYAARGEELDFRKIQMEAQNQLQREAMAQELEMQGIDITSREGQAALDRALEYERIAEESKARMASIGVDERSLELRAEQIANDARLRGEELDMREAISEAEIDLAREQYLKRFDSEEADRRTREYIEEMKQEFSYDEMRSREAMFADEIAQREQEAEAQYELARFELMTRLAQLMGDIEDLRQGGTTINIGGGGTTGGGGGSTGGGTGTGGDDRIKPPPYDPGNFD